MRLTPAQRDITREIQQLASHREPLNITAVKRRRPDLIQKAYSLTPFWGWKDALAAAGLDYKTINTELLDHVVCQICGGEAGILTSHLLHHHELPPSAYREEFPGAAIISETVRSDMMRKRQPLNHWEQPWSPEYALDRLEEYRRRKFPLNYAWMALHDRSLAAAALGYFGSWDEGLRRIGLTPEEIRLLALGRSLTRTEVVEQLQARRKRGLPLNYENVVQDDLRLANAIRRRFGNFERAYRAAGIDYRAVRLNKRYSLQDEQQLLAQVRRVVRLSAPARARAWSALRAAHGSYAQYRFGGWARVCETAGVPFTQLVGKRFPDKQSVIDELRQRLRQRKSVTASAVFYSDRSLYAALRHHFNSFYETYPLLGLKLPINLERQSRYRDAAGVIAEIQRRHRRRLSVVENAVHTGPERDQTLLRMGLQFFGSWWKALTAAGLDPILVQPGIRLARRLYPTRASVIRELQRSVLPAKDASRHAPPVIANARLCWQAWRLFGSWGQALQAAGMSPEKTRAAPFPLDEAYSTATSLIEAIQSRAKRKLKINTSAIREGDQKDYHLYRSACLCFGSWDDALREAGFDPRRVHLDQAALRRRYRSGNDVVEAIRQRATNGIPMNSTSVQKGKVCDYPLFQGAVRVFGSWDDALREAGFDPRRVHLDQVALRRRYRSGNNVVEAICQRATNGIPMNSTSIQKGRFADTALHRTAVRNFGSWDRALESAGFNPETVLEESRIRRSPYPDANAVLDGIHCREAAGLPLNSTSLQKGPHTDFALFDRARKRFGSWPAAIEAARQTGR